MSEPMHAVFLTFEFAGDSLAQVIDRYTGRVAQDQDIVSYTWLNDGATAGAFYVFQDVGAAERFLKSNGVRALALHPDVSDFFVRHFSTLGAISSAMPAGTAAFHHSDNMAGGACAIWQGDMDRVAEQPA